MEDRETKGRFTGRGTEDTEVLGVFEIAVGRGSVRTGRRATPFDALSLAQGRAARCR
jgi:hypothetical protein